MKRTVLTIFLPIVCFSVWLSCDNYEFPPSQYPKVATLPVKTSQSGIIFQGELSHLGNRPLINHGFIFALNESLSQSEQIELGPLAVTGMFESVVTSGLLPNTTYFVKAFVSTDSYDAYGELFSFKTPPQ